MIDSKINHVTAVSHMLELKFLRENLEETKKRLALRQVEISFDAWWEIDQKQRALKAKVENHNQRKNQASAEISKLKREKAPIESILQEMKEVSVEMERLESDLKKAEEEARSFLLTLPNLSHPSVPTGKDQQDNQEVRRWGKIPAWNTTPKSHFEIGEALGLLDFEAGAKIAGSRFVLYRGWGARLERGLINFMLDLHINEHGYQEVLPPFIANRTSMIGTGQLPKFEGDLFRLKDEDYFLIPTAEVPVTNIHRGEILLEEILPISYVAYTPCFRREAGSYGKDTRGLIRQHQFNKVELVKFSVPEASYALLERLLQDAEAVLKQLGLPYRVISLCTGDLGFAAAKTYDIEVWFPSQQTYREISSCSNFEAFQARRADIRYRTSGGKIQHLHTLNGSGLAVGRTVAALLENFQQEDGSVVIPEALRPYMGGVDRIRMENKGVGRREPL